MIKETNDIYSVVEEPYIESHSNVFYTRGLLFSLKPNDQRLFLYSDQYVIPVTLSRRSIFYYAHLFAEPMRFADGNQNLRSFLDDVCSYLKKVKKVQWINQNNPASFFFDYPAGSKHIPFGSHVVDLSLDEQSLWDNVHSKHRNVIKKAEKDGVVIVCGRAQELIDDFHTLDVDTWNRSGVVAEAESQIEERMKTMGENAIIYLAYLDGIPQSGALYYYNSAMCYYMFGANRDNPHTGSGNLLQWKAMLDMKARGVEKFSFVGCRVNEDEHSKYHGIQRFKERFGGELVQGFLFKMEFKPLYRKLFNLLVSCRSMKGFKYVPFRDIIDQEIHKWPQK